MPRSLCSHWDVLPLSHSIRQPADPAAARPPGCDRSAPPALWLMQCYPPRGPQLLDLYGSSPVIREYIVRVVFVVTNRMATSFLFIIIFLYYIYFSVVICFCFVIRHIFGIVSEL